MRWWKTFKVKIQSLTLVCPITLLGTSILFLPLSVARVLCRFKMATNVDCAGDLTFEGVDGDSIMILKRVLYCEQAWATLISLAALQKANSHFAYGHKQDMFEILSSSNRCLFRRPFVKDKNKWIFPYPITP